MHGNLKTSKNWFARSYYNTTNVIAIMFAMPFVCAATVATLITAICLWIAATLMRGNDADPQMRFKFKFDRNSNHPDHKK